MRDPKEFRERFARWKAGEQVYEAGRALPSFAEGKDTDEQEEVHYTGEITQGKKPSGIERAANWLLRKTGNNRMGLGGALRRAVDEVRDGRHPLNGLMKTGGAALFPYVGAAVEGAAALDAANEITKYGLDIPNTIQLAVPTVQAGAAAKKLKYPSESKPASLGAVADYHNRHPEILAPIDKNSAEMQGLREFYRNDVFPRFEKQMNKTGRTASITADELIDQTPYRQGPFLNDNYGGYYGPTGVVMNSKYAKNGKMLSHETNHALREKLGYTKEEDNILKEAYTFSNEYLKKHPGLAQRAEKSATNNEVRRAIAMKYNTKSAKELDSIIDKISDEELMSMYDNSYGIDFKKSFKPGLKPQRRALKSVASIVPLLAAKGIIQESFEDFDEELPRYALGIEGNNPTNATLNSDGTFTDDYTRVFDDLVITPKGPRVKPGQLHKYQEPWNDAEFMSAMTMGLNPLSPVHTGRALYNIATGSGYNDVAKDIFMPNAGLVTNKFEKEHPYISMAINAIADANVANTINKVQQLGKLSRLQRMVTGVPIKEDKVSGKLLSDLFREGYSGEVWTSNNPEYAKAFSNNGELFDVYFDPRKLKLLDTPDVGPGKYISWNHLPFTAKRGKIVLSDKSFTEPRKFMYDTKEEYFKNKPVWGEVQESKTSINPVFDKDYVTMNQHLLRGFKEGLKTDNVVKYSRKIGKDGVKFHRVYDGPLEDAKLGLYDIPIEEVVLNSGAERFWTEHGASRWGLFNQMPYKNSFLPIAAGQTSRLHINNTYAE